MDIGDWLHGLGLGQYAAAFRDNAIDASVLPSLTAEDLKDLGVALVGHRRRLLDAVAALGQEAAPTASAAPLPAASAEAERRQLTVLFCDLAGSTELAARLDPEDLRTIINAYHQAVAAVLTGFGGFVAKYMGDGVLAYFGYPEAHEEDCERAVRAGLAIVERVAGLDLSEALGAEALGAEPLAVRIGIATGLVVVGDLIGAGAAQEQAVVGETPNLAARLQALAEPNAIVIADATRRQVGTLFELRDLGSPVLKGFAAGQLVWRVVGESGVASRFEALRSGATPLVGRGEEIDLLLRRWAQATSGEGRVVLISAEPGIGKSRLAEAVEERIAAEPHTRLRYFCSPHHQDSAFHPVIGQLERAAGFNRADAAPAKQQKLAALFGESSPDELSLVAELLSLPATQAHSELELTPQRRKEKTFEALLGSLERLSRRQPVLMLFEDLHWMDPTSRELLDRVIARVEQWPVLLIATFRPEFDPPWTGLPQVTMLALNRLGRRDGARLVEQLVGNAGLPAELPAELIAEIVERTDGVPLFLEEVTKVVIETAAGSDSAARNTLAAIPGARLAVPATLQASLMARLDRLGLVSKEIAQIGAAIGREFSYELLSAVAPRGDAETQAALARLVAAGLVFQRGVPPVSDYRFKHALVQDTAYGTLLRGPRHTLHRRIAAALEEKFAEIVEAQPETVAHHLTEAGLRDRAVGYWLRAGQNAAARSANLEAIAHLRRSIDAIGSVPDGPAKDRLELDLQLALGPCLIATQGPISGASLANFARSRELCERIGDAPEYLQVMHWLAVVRAVRGELPESLEATEAGIALAQARSDQPALLNSMRGTALVLLLLGRLDDARALGERAIAAFDASEEAERGIARAAGQDAGAASLAVTSWALWTLGYADTAASRMATALDRAEAISHPHTQAYVCYYASILYALRGEATLAQRQAERCLALSQEHGFGHWQRPARIVREICTNLLDPSSSTIDDAQRELEDLRGTGYQMGITALCVVVGEALALRHRFEPLLDVVVEGLATMDRTSERFLEAELYRLKARALLAHGGVEAKSEARCVLDEALATARRQGARAIELRAARDLAGLWRTEGKSTEARELLAPIYGWFTEGLDTPDLVEAKALLDALS